MPLIPNFSSGTNGGRTSKETGNQGSSGKQPSEWNVTADCPFGG